MSKKKITVIILLSIIFILILLPVIGILVSKNLEVEKIRIEIRENGITLKILQISDLHYPKNGVSLEKLKEKTVQLNPDIIFLTGDIIDSQTKKEEITDLENFFKFLSGYKNVFAISGNHETINASLDYYKILLSRNNIIYLQNSFVIKKINNIDLAVVGIKDNMAYNSETIAELDNLDSSIPVILLAHRPEHWNSYISSTEAHKPLLTLSGHAHGGQFMLLGKGIYAPNQGYFPEYYDGLYTKNERFMVVSRGLGNSIFPFRIYNRFHLPFIELIL